MAKIGKDTGPSNASDPDATPPGAVMTFVAGNDTDLARRAYGAYAQAHDWIEYSSGEPIGAWKDADEDEQAAWVAAARAVRHAVQEPAGAGEIVDGPPDEGEELPAAESYPPYPEGRTAVEVADWVAGDPERAREALAYEQQRPGGARAGLSAELSRLAESTSGQA